MAEKTFRDLEYEGWTARAATYDDHFAELTRGAIGPILDSFGALAGRQLLDVGSGTGHLAAAAAARGARVLGVDFAETMVARAGRNYPEVRFEAGDAEALAHADESFDAVSCSFALLHLSRPEAAIAEARRVLRPGGRYSFTLWRGPEDGCAFFALTRGAIVEHGETDVGLPPGPPAYELLEDTASKLAAAGFAETELRDLPLVWRSPSTQGVLDAVYKGGVRTAMVLRAQTEERRARIERAILDGAERHRVDGQVELAMPAVLVTARKA